MAHFNWEEARQREKEKQNYDKLKESISNIDSEYFLAHEYLRQMEQKIKDQQEDLKRYHEFFATLKNLLPREFSMFDKIG